MKNYQKHLIHDATRCAHAVISPKNRSGFKWKYKNIDAEVISSYYLKCSLSL